MSKIDDLMKKLKEGKIKKEDTAYLYKVLSQIYENNGTASHDDEGLKDIPYPYNFIRALNGDYAKVYSEYDYAITIKSFEWVLNNLIDDKYSDIIYAIYRDHKTLEDAGKEFGISKEGARLRITKAIRTCRHPSIYHAIMYSDFEWNKRKEKEKQINELNAELSQKIIAYRNKINAINKALKEVGVEVPLTENEMLDYELDNLNLSIRAYNSLKRAGFSTVKDLTLVSYDDIKTIRNLGPKCAEEVKNKLIDLGLYFANEDNPEYMKKLKMPKHYLDTNYNK